MFSKNLAKPASGDLLAITFTNAAAAEMRNRVITRLKNAALGESADSIDRQLAKKWLNYMLRDNSSMNIRTIDSLLHLIVRSSALDLSLTPDFDTVFASEEILRPFLDLIWENARIDGNKYRTKIKLACQAIFDFSDHKGFLSKDVILKRIKSLTDPALLGQFANLSTAREIEEQSQIYINKFIDDSTHLLHLLATLDAKDVNKKAYESIENCAKGNFPDSPTAYLFKDSVDALLNGKATGSRQARDAYMKWAESGQKYYDTATLFNKARLLLPVLDLTNDIVKAYEANLHNENALPAVLIPQFAASLLNCSDGVSAALCRLGTKLSHFFIDESQDTSRSQWQVLKPLVHEAISRGGSLTWVGDIKQSIYGWRGGDANLFDEIGADKELLAIAQDVNDLKLESNRRSKKNIIEHTNTLFEQLNTPEIAEKVMEILLPSKTPEEIRKKAIEKLQTIYSDVHQKQGEKHSDDGYVESTALSAKNRDELDDLIIQTAKDKILDIGWRRPWSDMMVLTRKNYQAQGLAQELLDAGIPVITENSLLLSENSLIIQILALFEFISNPLDDQAFWKLITGSICAGANLMPDSDNMHDWAIRRDTDIPIYQSFRKDFPELWTQIFESFYKALTPMTAYDTCMEWLKRMNVEERFKEENTFIRRFMEVLHLAEDSGYSSVTAFLDYWKNKGSDEKVPMPEHMDAVKVITIHKSKGLAAPVVIVPWTNMGIKPSDNPDVITKDGLKLPIFINGQAAGDLYYEDMLKQALEALNLLYVAFTRPVDELHYFMGITKNEEKGARTTARVLKLLVRESGLTLPKGSPLKANPAVLTQKKIKQKDDLKLDGDWSPMQWLPRLKIHRSHPENQTLTAAQRGIFLHYCLEQMQFRGKPHEDAAKCLEFAWQNAPIIPPESEKQSLHEALRWFVSLPRAREWLEQGVAEQSMTDENGESLRPDLVTSCDDSTLVIDYKSGEPKAQDKEQIKKYIKCLKDSKQLEGPFKGLIVYLDKKSFQLIENEKSSPLTQICPI